MAYIKGSTDVANAVEDLYGIFTGTVGGSIRGSGQLGNGITAGVSAWTGIDATNHVIRSTETIKPFRTPIECYRGMPRFEYISGAGDPAGDASYNILKGKPTYSGIYTGTATNAFFTTYVTTQNTNVGFLTGLVVTYTEENADSGASIKGATTVSGWTGITSTKLLNDGVSLTLTLQPTDTLTLTRPPYWIRSYGASYPDGIDYIPEIAKYIGAGMSIGIASGSTNDYTATTDYTTARWIRLHETSQANDLPKSYEWGGNGFSIGIHWIAGGTPPAVGATYWVNDLDMYAAYAMCVSGSAGALAQWGIHICPMDYWDEVNANGRNIYNIAIQSLQPAMIYSTNRPLPTNLVFTTANPSSTSYINYWISMKTDKIVALTRGDLSASGQLSMSSFQRYTTSIPTIDKWNWGLFTLVNLGLYQPLFSPYVVGSAVYNFPYYGPTYSLVTNETTYGQTMYPRNNTLPTYRFLMAPDAYTPIGSPSQIDGKWKLYSIDICNTFYGKAPATSKYSATQDNCLTATMRGVYRISSPGWNSLDELIDGSNIYLLVDLGTDAASYGRYIAMLQE